MVVCLAEIHASGVNAKAIAMAIGMVKMFHLDRGYGFIAPLDGGEDVFVHVNAVKAAGIRDLFEGQTVTYDVVTQRGRPAATNLNLG
jgi:CspA family cold shock protein